MDKINAETMRKAYEENFQTFVKKNTDYCLMLAVWLEGKNDEI